MAVRDSVNKLKDGPKEDKQVVAISTASVVMIVLLIGWGFLFLKSLRQEQAASQSYDSLDIPQDTGSTPGIQQTSTTYDTLNDNPFTAPTTNQVP